MKEAILEQTAVDIEPSTPRKEIFRANGQTVNFDGFIRVYTEGRDDDASDEIEGRTAETGKRNGAHARRSSKRIRRRLKISSHPALHRTAARATPTRRS